MSSVATSVRVSLPPIVADVIVPVLVNVPVVTVSVLVVTLPVSSVNSIVPALVNPFATVRLAVRLELVASTSSVPAEIVSAPSIAVVASTAQFSSGTIDIASGQTLTFTGATTTVTNQSSGTIKGAGTLNVSAVTFNNDGAFSPAGDGTVGTLSITGNVAQSNSSLLTVDIASLTSVDRLAVSGTYAVDGTLDLNFLSTPSSAGTSNSIISFATSAILPFDTVTDNLSDSYLVTTNVNATNVTITVAINIDKTFDNGGGGGAWETAANWSPDGVPTFSDSVLINDATITYSTAASSFVDAFTIT